MSNTGRALITDATGATTFGPGTFNNGYILINRGADLAYLEKQGTTAVKEKGMSLAANEAVNTNDLPQGWSCGTWTAVCSTGETAKIDYTD